MSLVKEFKEFAVKGNAIDMAVGIVVGAAFGKIVSSFVANVVTPPLGVLLGGVDLSNLEIVLQSAAGDAPAVTMQYGVFVQSVIDFLIVAVAIFAVVKLMNSLERKEEAQEVPVAPSKQEVLLEEIRDLLKK